MLRGRWLFLIALFTLTIFTSNSFAAEKLNVIFLAGEGWFGKDGYRYSLLDLALSRSGQSYQIKVEDTALPQERRSRIIEKSPKPYIMDMGTSPAREQRLRAIYLPVFLGIGSGYRLVFNRKGLQEKLRLVRNINDLKKYTFGQGSHWSDIPILEGAGLKVISVAQKKLLWRMTEAGRFDLFPRGMFEIFEEHKNFKKQLPNLVINVHLLISYSFAIYFFVNKANENLATAVEAGMRKAYFSGEIQNLLMRKIGKELEGVLKTLNQRLHIKLPPHNISSRTLETIQRYTFDFARIN